MYWFRNCHDQDGLRCFLCHRGVYHRVCSTHICQKVSQLSPLLKSPRAPVGKLELDASSPREISGLFIHQSAPLFLPYERLRSFCHCFLSHSLSLGILFSSAFPPYSRFVVPFPIVAYLSSGSYPPGNPKLLPEKSGSVLYPLASLVVEHFKSNIYQ